MGTNLFGNLWKCMNTERGLIFLLLLSLAIKTLLLLSTEIVEFDGVRYVEAARQFAEGNFREGLHFEKMPFYPLLIVLFNFFIRDWELAGRLISVLAMVFALVPLYLLTKALFDQKAAF